MKAANVGSCSLLRNSNFMAFFMKFGTLSRSIEEAKIPGACAEKLHMQKMIVLLHKNYVLRSKSSSTANKRPCHIKGRPTPMQGA